MQESGKSAADLKEVICRVIRDLEVTPAEYDQVMAQANADGRIDAEEQALLAQFHEMINDGTIKRVRG